MKRIMVSEQMQITISHMDTNSMVKELRAIYRAISLLELVDNIVAHKNVKKIAGENMYVYRVSSKLRMVFTESQMDDGTPTYILLNVFKHDDYVKFLKSKGPINDLMN